MKQLLIYGATGFTGGLIVNEALAFGIKPILAGRSRAKLEALARRDGLEFRCASLDDLDATRRMLEGVAVVINAAGPFNSTAVPLASAAIARGSHYLDISGEIAAMRALGQLDNIARRGAVMVMPGAGFDVVPSDCMAAYVVRRLPTADTLEIGLKGLDAISRGSALSLFEQYADLVTVRRGGRLVRSPPGDLEQHFDFGDGPDRTAAISWGDVVSAYLTTGIPNITVFYEATAIVQLGLYVSRHLGWLLRTPGYRAWLQTSASLLPAGPSDAQRARGRATVVVRASDSQGGRAEVCLHTPEVYSFTATASVAIADRVLHGDVQCGVRTPGSTYGPDFVLSLPGVTMVERK